MFTTKMGMYTKRKPSKRPLPLLVKALKRVDGKGCHWSKREQAKQLMDQYGSEEGFRRLQESDPEAARQFELVRRPAQDTPSGDTPPDEAP